ncbi:methyltransferase domain-containing protein [Natrialbaceae archaeon A-chndr2]|uniref:methyltransferase domain-containing protein n=1 Tax=Natronosalvus amylolyticus TaxID=2961994 RepID=UPI0020C9C5DE|nr:methyltransferase domain-containing protein [Natronosalvus amylolyticus]
MSYTDQLDTNKLEAKVKAVYQDVAQSPDEDFHFEMGRPLAERLGYDPANLDQVPQAAVDSFAGVGYHFDLAAIEPGERVLDLGSGSGMDVFVASIHAGETGEVVGLDMTDEQLKKARQLRDDGGFENVRFEHGYIESLPFDDGTFDIVISNGVINLSPEKERVFEEIRRVLGSDGRLALSDIISEEQMPESIKTSADLWAACIGGAMQVDNYTDALEESGLEVATKRRNDEYAFISDQAAGACEKYGVNSISVLARMD